MAEFTNQFISNMRESPSDFSPEQQRSSKRAATVQQPSSSASSSGGQLLQNGFTKIPLPSTRLGRTLSAPIPTKNLYDQFSDGALTNSLIANSSPEENSGLNSVPVRTQPSQQPQKPLYRTYSEPIPAASQAVATSATPRPPEAGKVMYPAGRGIQESPDAKSFRRMKDRMREMRKWWDEVITEGEEEDASGSDNDDNHSPSNVNEMIVKPVKVPLKKGVKMKKLLMIRKLFGWRGKGRF